MSSKSIDFIVLALLELFSNPKLKLSARQIPFAVARCSGAKNPG